MKIRDVPQTGSVGENITYLAKFHLLPVGKRIFIRTVQQIVMQRIVSWGRSRDGSGFAPGNRSVDTEGFCKSQMTRDSGLRWLRARSLLAVFGGTGGIACRAAPEATPSGGGQLPARPPLRTVLESFPSYGSSPHKDSHHIS